MFWKVDQAALFLGLKPHQVYYLLFMGKIEAIKIGRTWRVVTESARAYKEKSAA